MARLRKSLPFGGLPFAGIKQIPSGTRAVVLGAGTALGSPHGGAENGPYFLRTVSKAYSWGARQPTLIDVRRGVPALAEIVDLGDLEFGDAPVPMVLDQIRAVIAALPDQVVPAVLGGDHTVTLPVVTALAARREPFTVLQFDHHLDLQTWDGAPGDPRAARDPIFHTNVMSHVADVLGPGRLLQVGVSPYAVVEDTSAPAMASYLASVGRQVPVLAPELDADAFRAVVGSGGDLYVTVDVDVLDDAEMSSTGYPADVGLAMRTLLELIDVALASNHLVGFDVVEFVAARDARDRKTLADASRAAHIFLHLLTWAGRQGESS